MKIYRSIDQFSSDIKTVITIGTFDGLHKGHRHILKRLNEIARKKSIESVLLSFHPHPRHVLFPDNQSLKLLNTMEEKIVELERLGLQNFIIHEFTRKFSRIKSINFIRDILKNQLNMQYMVVGYNHHFGKNREGSFDELQDLSELYSFGVEKISAHENEGITISSTKIRTALLNGNVEKANTFLGYKYMLSGKVIYGNQLGRKLGFPTANIKVQDDWKLIPKDGVYVVKVKIDKANYFGMLNIGIKPTLTNNQHTIEVHIFEFSQQIYDQKISLQIIKRIRDEKQFDELGSLQVQLKKDENKCKQFLGLLR